MKHEARSILTAILLVVTAIAFCWAALLVTVGTDVLGMFHMAAPSSAEYRKMLGDVCADSKKLLCLAVVPMTVVTLLWMVAFLHERRRNKNQERTFRQQSLERYPEGLPPSGSR